jgi:hypothetical protein
VKHLEGEMNDLMIRDVLRPHLTQEYGQDSIIIDELGICQGEARVDLAVINGALHGYEIKSERDTLVRLSKQAEFYNRVFDTVTIIAGSCHLENVCNIIPDWWGIIEARFNDRKVDLISVKSPLKNDNVDPFSVAQLLWREEALELLKSKGLHKGYVSKSRMKIWERIAETISLSELQTYVVHRLKSREKWR